jgi:hypothetical protein
VVRRKSDDAAPFSFFDLAGNTRLPDTQNHREADVMQVPSFNANDTSPAADPAVPGTWGSCAVEPLHPAIGNGGRACGGRGARSIHPKRIPQCGQDRRYEKHQRGRAVACA